MEESKWEKDNTPYLVFPCRKCKQFSYVKTSQKTKRCLRCGYSHFVKDIIGGGEIVYGMTAAVEGVKKRQNEILLNKAAKKLEFRSENDYILTLNGPKENLTISNNGNKELEFTNKFIDILIELSKSYKEFPRYLIEIMADNYAIPQPELSLLIRHFREKGILTISSSKAYYYKVNFK